ncbi:DMT family transporter [Bacillus sp. 31A1R]|uniref:DMT family transporter n=1 Tax=Robertmurraya mangrovi TaxID=3098077 RepID=A0ABU5ITS7_9BACI|nr:DMT family transporter [Bacillus sp. 31A1R]MDZ5470539.1 DMT family transporter [Bacillus sp. 31A1R]
MYFYYLLLLLTSFLWAGNFIAGKFMVGHASSLVLTEIRWVIAIIALVPIIFIKEKTFKFNRKALLPLIGMGATGIVIFNLFMFLALKHTTADNVGLISTLNPIAIAIFSFIFFKEKLSPQKLFAIVISFIGIIIVLSHGDFSRLLNLHFNMGDFYMIIAVAAWGLYSTFGKMAMNTVSPFLSTFWSGVFGVIMILPFISTDIKIVDADSSFWIASLYTGIGATVLGMVFWNIGVKQVGSTMSGMFLNFNPIFTAGLAYVFLGERMGAAQWTGAFIVIVGVLLFTNDTLFSKLTFHSKKVSKLPQ